MKGIEVKQAERLKGERLKGEEGNKQTCEQVKDSKIREEDKNMTREELFRKNQQLSTEFELYLLEHPEIEDNIPDNAMIVLLPEYDKELSESNIELAEANKEEGQAIVYVRVKKLRTSRIEGLTQGPTSFYNIVH